MLQKRKTCVILARVSGYGQEDGYSLESQTKLLCDYCEKNDYQVKEIYRIVETASKEHQRKIFNQLLQYLKDENIDLLIVEKTDRFARNFKDAVALDEWMNADENRALIAVKENLVVHKNAKSDVKFMWNIHLAVAKKYSDNLREEVMKGWTEKLAQGWMPAPPPPGYMTVLKDGRKIHVHDPNTSNAVKLAFKMYLRPEHSIQTIANELTKLGVTTKRDRPFTKSYVHKMLSNPFYVGIIHFNGKTYPGKQQPLISEDLFNQVQDKMNGRAPKITQHYNHALKGMMTCLYCGKLITWQHQKGFLYGACQRKLQDCRKKKFVREDKVQVQIQESLDGLVNPSNELMTWIVDMINNEMQDTTDNREETAEFVQGEIERIERMDEILYEDRLAGEISVERYKEKHDSFEEQKVALKQRLDSFDDNVAVRHEEAITILKLSQTAAQSYKELEDVEEKRVLLTKLFKSMVVNDNSVSVKYTKFVAAIARTTAKTKELLLTNKKLNQTIQKGLSTRGKSDLLSGDDALRSIWCG